MFGYISPVLSVLNDSQKHRYRSFYCGVCHSLRKRYGQSCRLSLSNDMTFLAILLTSLYEPAEISTRERCALHPLKPHSCLSSPMIDYAADMNALLFWYKCKDQSMDDHSVLGKAGEKVFLKASDSVRKLWPVQAEKVEYALSELWKEEGKTDPDPDLLCNLSGEMLASVFVPDPKDTWSKVLYAVGAGLGRFVYWMDAWEDYDEDLKKGRFNPLVVWHERPDYNEFCLETLELLMSDAAESFEILPLEQDLDLMRNIIYSGAWQRWLLKQNTVGKKEDAFDK